LFPRTKTLQKASRRNERTVLQAAVRPQEKIQENGKEGTTLKAVRSITRHISTRIHERFDSTKYERTSNAQRILLGTFLGKVHLKNQAYRKILQD
jgi:hypothetical protein